MFSVQRLFINFCASFNPSCVGQTHQHLKTKIDEHFGKDKKSRIYQPLMPSADVWSRDCFSILDIVKTKHPLRIMEILFINWLKATL